jgi:hypothetical protein
MRPGKIPVTREIEDIYYLAGIGEMWEQVILYTRYKDGRYPLWVYIHPK